MKMNFKYFSILFIWFFTLAPLEKTFAQPTDLILSMTEINGEHIPVNADAIFAIEVNFEEMRYLPEELKVTLPDGNEVVFYRTSYSPTLGYEWHDPPLDFTVPAASTIEDMAYSWSGSSENNRNKLIMTVSARVMYSSIWVGAKKFIIRNGSEDHPNIIYQVSGSGVPAIQNVNTLDLVSLIILMMLLGFFTYKKIGFP